MILGIVLVFGCAKKPTACTEEAKLCPDGSTVGRIPPDCEFAECPEPAGMTLEEAVSIAQGSDCAKEGSLTNTSVYNEATKTWWINLDIEKEGCNPACVVKEDGTAEINWRCTGLVTE